LTTSTPHHFDAITSPYLNLRGGGNHVDPTTATAMNITPNSKREGPALEQSKLIATNEN
jgi:hypothetical protein